MMNTLAFGVGPWEVAVIALIGLLIFGGRLPSVMKDMAKGIKGFQSELRRTEQDIDQAASVPPQLEHVDDADQVHATEQDRASA